MSLLPWLPTTKHRMVLLGKVSFMVRRQITAKRWQVDDSSWATCTDLNYNHYEPEDFLYFHPDKRDINKILLLFSESRSLRALVYHFKELTVFRFFYKHLISEAECCISSEWTSADASLQLFCEASSQFRI